MGHSKFNKDGKNTQRKTVLTDQSDQTEHRNALRQTSQATLAEAKALMAPRKAQSRRHLDAALAEVGLTPRGKNAYLRTVQAFLLCDHPERARQLAASLRVQFLSNPGLPFAQEMTFGVEGQPFSGREGK
jgi:hypothetical protein